MQTSKNSTAPPTPAQLTLFPADSHASHIVSPGSEKAQMMTARSGQRCFELYAKFTPLGWFAKMLLESLAWNSTTCLMTWKAQATPYNRLLFRLAPSMLSTGGTESGLLPTPLASSATNSSHVPSALKRDTIPAFLNRFLPTPVASDGKTGDMGRNRSKKRPSGARKTINLETVMGDLSHKHCGTPTITPIFFELLMGYPEGWTEISESKPSEMPSCHK